MDKNNLNIELEDGLKVDQAKIIEYLQKCNNGVTDKVLRKNFPDLDPKNMVVIINTLLSTGSIDLFKTASNSLIYKYNQKDLSENNENIEDSQEKLVYQVIKESGNKGIWIRDIRFKSNLLLAQLNKILKNLEGRKLVKSVKSVAASKKKVYMLFHLEPDQSLTGGAWYSDQDFESEFVDILNGQCLKYLKAQADAKLSSRLTNPTSPKPDPLDLYTPLGEIKKYITELGISKVPLSLDDIEMIMSTLVYDNEVEQLTVPSKALISRGLIAPPEDPSSQTATTDSTTTTKLYRILDSSFPPTKSHNDSDPKMECDDRDQDPRVEPCLALGMASRALISVPFGICPPFDMRAPENDVSPQNCSYYNEWLKY